MLELDLYIGQYNNFLQHWKENIDEEMHQVIVDHPHPNIHVALEKSTDKNDVFVLTIFEGRSTNKPLENYLIQKKNDSYYVNDAELIYDPASKNWSSSHGSFAFGDNQILIHNVDCLAYQHADPFICNKGRLFTGWIQYPPDVSKPDDLIDLRTLEIHDQGGLAEVKDNGIKYTVELVQLEYAHTIEILKLAIYDCAIEDLEITRKAISYTWVNPEATRVGINLRKILTGWTLIEDDYINSTNLNKE